MIYIVCDRAVGGNEFVCFVFRVLWRRKDGFPGGSHGKESTCNAGDLGSIPGVGRSPEEEMTTHSSILDCRISWTGKPGRLQSMGSPRVGHD